MKKAVLGVILCFFLATFSYSMGLSLKLTGGAAYITSGDYNDGIDGMNSYYSALGYDPLTGTFSKLQLGMSFGGEVILDINENWGIGLGVGYMQFSHDTETVTGTYTFNWVPLGTDTYTLKPTVTSIPITLNVHYTMPMGGVKLNIFAGVGYYISKMKTDSISDSWFDGSTTTNSFTSNSMGGQFGFQGGLGLEVPLGGSFSFVVDITGRYVSLTDIKGDYTESGMFLGIPYSSSGNDQYFYAYRNVLNGTTYKMLAWMTDADGGLYDGATHGKFDLTGVSAQAGFKVSF